MRKNHGQSKTRLYSCWIDMRKRGGCIPSYSTASIRRYKDAGITVCDEWNTSWESFRKWSLENGYSDNLTLDRVDNSGNYCPNNCRWVDRREQAINTRAAKSVYCYTESGTLVAWFATQNEAARFAGCNVSAISQCARGKIKKAGCYTWRYTEGGH